MTRPFSRVAVPTIVLFIVAAGCRCDDKTQKVQPSAGIAPPQVNFGKVKVGSAAPGAFTVSSLSRASVQVNAITLEDGSAPGGASAFALGEIPTIVEGLQETTVNLTFAPDGVKAFEALAKVETNDPENPTLTVLLSGEGAQPDIVVTPQCQTDAGCVGNPVIANDELDFGSDAFARTVPIPANKLPNVSIVNEGDVELIVKSIGIDGTDAAAFTLVGNTTLPDLADDGVTRVLRLDQAEGVNLPIRFRPTSETQQSYTADLVITSDDPDEAEVRVHLKGALRPNLPPVICANVIKVISPDSITTNFNTAADWAPLLTPPPGGYDFTQTRAIEPSRSGGKNSIVSLSAFSSSDASTCTTDPEDERNGLTYAWTLEQTPGGAGSATLGGAATATPTFIPVATGEYVIRLTVRDAQAHETSTTLKLAVVRKEDLVAQLSWNGADGGFKNSDLDIHLIRPSSVTDQNDPFSGAFSYFSEGTSSTTSGDRNGYADAIQRNPANTGFNYDWGDPGSADDPSLNLDETGNGPLIENISLNYPENDPQCATAACRYKVMVHFFRDDRAPSNGSCTVGGSCKDGEQCNCPSPELRCVADNAPKGDAGTGNGKCVFSPQANVRIFVRANPTPAAEIPLPPNTFTVPAPCHMVYVADVYWPRKGAPDGGTALDGGSEPVIVPRSDENSAIIGRFGYRTQGSLTCTPDESLTGPSGLVQWYGPEPR